MSADVPQAPDLVSLLREDGFFTEDDLSLPLSVAANEPALTNALRQAGFSGRLVVSGIPDCGWLYYAYDVDRLDPAEARKAAIARAKRSGRPS